jgi:hypothetical protein
MPAEETAEKHTAGKETVNLTGGGSCENCDDQSRCCVCGKEPTVEDPLYYAQSGDHDHLVNRDGALVLEAHGRLMCEEHYLADAKKMGISKKDLGWPEPAKD